MAVMLLRYPEKNATLEVKPEATIKYPTSCMARWTLFSREAEGFCDSWRFQKSAKVNT